MRKGFTLVEIVVTVTIIGILLILAFVNLTSSQVNARDSERKSDVETAAVHLETYYASGFDETAANGSYPSTALTTDVASMKSALRDVDLDSITAPGAGGPLDTFISATNAIETVGGVTPSPTVSEYVYQPLAWNGSGWVLCEEGLECRRFNIFYRLETDDAVYKVSSRTQ